MKFTRKKAVLIGAVIFVGAFICYKALIPSDISQGVMVTTSPVEVKTIEDSITLKAPLEGTEYVEITSRLNYEVIKVNVQEGDVITKGQLLAVLDNSEINTEVSIAKDALELTVIQNQERLEDLQESYNDAVIKYEEAKRQLEITKVLAETGAETQENYRKEEATLNELKTKVDSFNLENGVVVSDVSSIKTEEIAQRALSNKVNDLKDCEIRSSIDGTVTRVNAAVGRYANDTDSKKPMFIVENIDSLKMKVLVSEFDISKIEVGQYVEVSVETLNDATVSATVSRISPTGEAKEGSTTERVIPIEIEITETNENLIPGINAKARILLSSSENAKTVPIESVLQNADGTFVVYKVVEGGTVHIVPVTLGIENEFEIEIISDEINEGDSIILNPTMDLTEGTIVLTPTM